MQKTLLQLSCMRVPISLQRKSKYWKIWHTNITTVIMKNIITKMVR